jgi:hypothetical protein
MNCNCCYTDYIGKCEESLTLNTQLTPGDTYKVVITDKFDHQYEIEAEAGDDGTIVIPVDDIPPGLLTEYSGDFQIQIYDDTCKPINFRLTGEYDCISFHVRGGTFAKDFIGCPAISV